MKAGAKATKEAVFRFCNEFMISDGRIPTVRDILKATGGSLSTITPLREEWGRSIAAQFREGKIINGLPAELSASFLNIWEAATAYASNALSHERLELQRQIQASEQSVALANERSTAAEQRAIQAEQASAAAQLAQDRASELLAERIADHQGIVGALSTQLQLASDAHVAENARWDEDRRRFLLQVDSQRQDILRLQAAASRLESQLSDSNARLSEEAHRCNALSESLAAARTSLDAARSAEQLALSKLSELSTKHEALAAELESKDELLKSQVDALAAQANATRAFTSGLEDLKKLVHPGTLQSRRRNKSSAQKKPSATRFNKAVA